jgi:hypothetical protein
MEGDMLEYIENLSPQEQKFLRELQIFELRPYQRDSTSLTRPVDIGMRELLGLSGILEGDPLTQEHVAEALHSIGVVHRFYHVDTAGLLRICMAFQTLLLYQVQEREGQFFDLITAMLNNSNPAE